MFDRNLVICLPITDRAAAYDFFTNALGFSTVGDLGEDGLPEPLQLYVSNDVQIMLIPRGGFTGITNGRVTYEPGISECVLTLPVPDRQSVDRLLDAALGAGATLAMHAEERPWGYVASFVDLDGHLWMLRAD